MMKRYIRFITFCLMAALGLSLLAGCKEKGDYAIKVGEQIVTENDYHRYVSLLRTSYLSMSQAEDSAEFWGTKTSDNSTESQYLTETAQSHLINTKLYSAQFDRLGLSFSEEEQSKIDSTLSEMVESQGGMSSFISYLSGYNYTYEEYLVEYYDILKKSKVLNYYYGADGQQPVALQDIKDYYNVHNALVKAVYILKVDESTGESLDEAALKAAEKKAQEAYDAALRSGETDNFEDVISIFSDVNQTESVVIPDDGSYDAAIADPVLAMEIGEVIKLDLDTAHMIIKRYDGTADDVFTATMQQATLETIREDEITALLEQWKSETDIKINKKITKKYAPEKLIGEQ